ncbi:hypothetical protein MMC30_005296 [Trapelia coarctata]|nr:hypothetical protein [Trapelia coarctata]
MCLQKNALDGRPYLPEDCLDRILRAEIITYQLEYAEVSKQLSDPDVNILVEYIIREAGRVFLILTKLGWSSRIVGFKERGFTDADLPISVSHQWEAPYDVIIFPREGLAHKAFEEWAEDNSDIDDFANIQWSFMAPVLTARESIWFSEKTILPIADKGEEKQGGFSKVTKVMFHPAHIEKALNPSLKMALKESVWDLNDKASHSNTADVFISEFEALDKMRDLNHDHLIKYVTNFVVYPKLYIVLPWAEAGNLRSFWFEDNKARTNPEFITWVLEQLAGLFDGISKMHSKECIHGDLTPENLLLFPQHEARPRIVVADFGLARVYSLKTAARKAANQHTKTIWKTPLYEPPEFEDPASGQPFSRSKSNDMWQMGCISLEFLIWLLWGPAACTTFFQNNLKAGKFWINTTPKTVHPEVLTTIQWMKAGDFRCGENTVGGDLLLLVEKLLVVETEGKDCRANSTDALEEVTGIHQKARQIPSYVQDCGLVPNDVSSGLKWSRLPPGFLKSRRAV